MGTFIKGVRNLQKDFEKQGKKKRKGFERGLKKAGLFLQTASQEIVPVEFSVLKNSAQTRAIGTGSKFNVLVSYGTDYAIYVHEDLEAKHKSGKVAKFLEKPARENQDEMVAIVVVEIKKTR